jgi:hypothetical protein
MRNTPSPLTPPSTVALQRSSARWLAGAALVVSALSLPLLVGCASPQASDYAALTPKLDLQQYFNGPLVAHGIVTDRNGKLLQRFTAQITGTWKGNIGTLDEQFTYSDGRKEQRIWTLTRLDNGRYTGRAADVVGEADGQAAGPALNWRYTLRVPVDGREWDLQFDDWMFQMDDQVMINRAQMRKFGIVVGEVLLAFRRLPA